MSQQSQHERPRKHRFFAVLVAGLVLLSMAMACTPFLKRIQEMCEV